MIVAAPGWHCLPYKEIPVHFSFHPNFHANWPISMPGGGMTCGLRLPAGTLISQIFAIMPFIGQCDYRKIKLSWGILWESFQNHFWTAVAAWFSF
jgi:hypothetical protein